MNGAGCVAITVALAAVVCGACERRLSQPISCTEMSTLQAGMNPGRVRSTLGPPVQVWNMKLTMNDGSRIDTEVWNYFDGGAVPSLARDNLSVFFHRQKLVQVSANREYTLIPGLVEWNETAFWLAQAPASRHSVVKRGDAFESVFPCDRTR